MAWFECDAGKRYYIFGKDGGVREAEETLNVPLLGRIPIDIETRERGDAARRSPCWNQATNKVSAAFPRLWQLAKIRSKVRRQLNDGTRVSVSHVHRQSPFDGMNITKRILNSPLNPPGNEISR